MQDFELLVEKDMQEVSGVARVWRHKKTGAELLSICNNDENKCFGVTFRTPPSDSSGVAHILEHSVLCGSEKYPVREPFVELLKGSLQTFLNAFTFPDKTCYPVASTNLQDFYNLIDVYIDAVFHPRITEDIFHQEGWHVEADSPEGPWHFKGVVYNEMKGVYSTPDSMLAEASQQAVFPDMLYSLDSGGHPPTILTLSYENFKAFHTDFYHPSNARFFFWGDDAEEKRLEIVAAELSRFEARSANSTIPLQKRLDMPRHLEFPYAISGQSDAGADARDDAEDADSTNNENKSMFTVNWLLCETADTQTALLLEMLEHILEGLPGSPLRKALIESGLGEDTTGIGLETDLRQMYYSVGLKGLAHRNVAEAELLIFDTLAALVEEGIPADAIEAAVNSVEFQLRENNSGRFPRGLSAMIQSLSTWLYDGDPLAPLAWEAPLASIKARLAEGEKIFEDAIEQFFLKNDHRSTVVLLPDPFLAEQREEAEAAHLQRLHEACSSAEREELVQETQRLRALQEEPDSPEDLARIPAVTPKDVPLKNTPLPIRVTSTDARPDASVRSEYVVHELDTSGVVYMNVLLSLQSVPERLLPLVSLFGRALTEMGTTTKSFVEMGTHIARKTGGVWAAPFFTTHKDSAEALAYLSVGGKVVRDKIHDLFAIFHEVLFAPRFDQQERFLQMALEAKARLEHGLLAGGHSTVSTRLRAQGTRIGQLEELTGGITYLGTVRKLIQDIERNWPSVLADLQELYTLTVHRNGCILDCTADGQSLGLVEPHVARLRDALPVRDLVPQQWSSLSLPRAEVFTAPSQINFVGKGANLFDMGYTYHGSAHVILRHLRMGYLWEKVRVQGGAYGAFCALDRLNGMFVQASYRDPSVRETIAVYDKTCEYLRTFDPTQRELDGAIVGAIGDLDSYMLPDAKGAASLTRHMCGDSDEARQRMRDEILSTTKAHFNDFADIMKQVADSGALCVLGGSKAHDVALQEGWNVTELL